MSKKTKAIDFQDYLGKQLRNPKIKKYYDQYGKQLEIAYGILQLRKQRGLSQAQLARKIGTSQSNIARIEAGKQNFTLSSLLKIAQALDYDLEISFSPDASPWKKFYGDS